MSWKNLENIEQLEDIVRDSQSKSIAIFKHSTTCPISFAAKMRMDELVSANENAGEYYYLDLLQFRTISNEIAERFQVHHESPQIVVLKNGEVIYDESHLDIQAEEVRAQML